MNVREIIQKIEEKSADGDYIYRGEPENYEDYPYYGKVSSSLWRFYDKVDPVALDVEEIQKSILQEARRYAESDKNDFELLAEIQHYDGKTNLIDFTTDHLNALFFACDGSSDKCGRVILLHRTEEMREKYRIQEPRTPQHRIIAQKSIFVQPRYGYIEDGDYCVIDVPKDLKDPMLDHLRQYHGIFTRKIYNDLHGYIKHQEIHRDAYIHLGLGLFYQVKELIEVVDCNDEAIKHLSKAIQYFSEAIKLNRDFAEAYYHRGEAYHLKGLYHCLQSNTGSTIEDFTVAIKDYTASIKLDTNFAEAYHSRGQVYSTQKDYARAIEDFNRAIQLDPNNSEVHINRGEIYFTLKDYARAIEDFNRAIQLDPNSRTARFYYDQTQEKLKESNES